MTWESIDQQKEKRALELQNEYIYLKALDWFKDNRYDNYMEFGFEK